MVLENKFGIKDVAELAKVEEKISKTKALMQVIIMRDIMFIRWRR